MMLTVIKNVLNVLLVFKIPQLPTETMSYIDNLFSYLETGASILANYTPLSYLLVMFGVLLAVDTGILLYHFVMWVIKKIPFLGME